MVEAVLTSTQNLCFTLYIRQNNISLYTPVFLYEIGVYGGINLKAKLSRCYPDISGNREQHKTRQVRARMLVHARKTIPLSLTR